MLTLCRRIAELCCHPARIEYCTDTAIQELALGVPGTRSYNVAKNKNNRSSCWTRRRHSIVNKKTTTNVVSQNKADIHASGVKQSVSTAEFRGS